MASSGEDLRAPLLTVAGPVGPVPCTIGSSACALDHSCWLSSGQKHNGGAVDAAQKKVQRKLLITLVLASVFLAVEVVGGYLAQSVAIMSDAAHMLSDVASFGLSLLASHAVTWTSHHSYSFGYHRAEIIGALFSTLIIWAVTGALVWEAVQRVLNPQPVNGKIMFIVACAGVGFNILLSLVLGEHHVHGIGGHDHDHDHGHSHVGHSETGHSHSHVAAGGQGSAEGGHDHAAQSSHTHSHGPGTSHGDKQQEQHHNHEHADGHAHANGHACQHHAHDGDSDDSHSEEGHHEDEHEHHQDSTMSTEQQQQHAGGAEAHKSSTPALPPLPRSHPAHSCASNASAAQGMEAAVAAAAAGSQEQGHRHNHGKQAAAGRAKQSGKPHSHDPHNHSHDHHNHSHDHMEHSDGTGHSHSHADRHDHGHGHSHGNMNMRSAVLHVLGDLLQSIGVAIAGALIWWHEDDPRWVTADPICTFMFAALVLLTTRSIIQDIIHTLMERTPVQHDIVEMLGVMQQIDGVRDVHDLHVWNLSMGLPIMTAHVHVDPDASTEQVLKRLESFARSRGIQHSTVQICNPPNITLEQARSQTLPPV